MSKNIGRKNDGGYWMWKSLSYEVVIYFNCIYFPNFLQACFTVSSNNKQRSYKTKKEQQKNKKGSLCNKTTIKPNSDIVK